MISRYPTAGIIADGKIWRETLTIYTEDTGLPCRQSHICCQMMVSSSKHVLKLCSSCSSTAASSLYLPFESSPSLSSFFIRKLLDSIENSFFLVSSQQKTLDQRILSTTRSETESKTPNKNQDQKQETHDSVRTSKPQQTRTSPSLADIRLYRLQTTSNEHASTTGAKCCCVYLEARSACLHPIRTRDGLLSGAYGHSPTRYQGSADGPQSAPRAHWSGPFVTPGNSSSPCRDRKFASGAD